ESPGHSSMCACCLRDEHVLQNTAGSGRRSLPCSREGTLDFRVNLDGCLAQLCARSQLLLDVSDRIFEHPLGQLSPSLDTYVHVEARAHMTPPTERPAFQQRRTISFAPALHRAPRRIEDQLNIVPVHTLTRHGVERPRFVKVIRNPPLAPMH